MGGVGFASIPGGTFVPDTGAIKGVSYSWALRRWVNISVQKLSPDGLQFAYESVATQPNYDIHIVDIANGSDRVVYTGPYVVRAWTKVGVAVAYYPNIGIGGVPLGLWLVDPKSGALRKLDGTKTWAMFGQDAAWSWSEGGLFPAPTVYRLDLLSGAITSWFHTDLADPNAPPSEAPFAVVVGFDPTGKVMIGVFKSYTMIQAWLTDSPTSAIRLPTIPGDVPSWLDWPGLSDTNGIWMVGQHGELFEYWKGSFRQIGPSFGDGNLNLAGPCL